MKSESQQDILTHDPTIEESDQYPTGGRLIFIVLCLALGSLLVAVDTTIISVAIPRISTEFKALDDIGWYGSAYLVTLTAFQPTLGNVYKTFNPRAAYLGSIVIFEGELFVRFPFNAIQRSRSTAFETTALSYFNRFLLLKQENQR